MPCDGNHAQVPLGMRWTWTKSAFDFCFENHLPPFGNIAALVINKNTVSLFANPLELDGSVGMKSLTAFCLLHRHHGLGCSFSCALLMRFPVEPLDTHEPRKSCFLSQSSGLKWFPLDSSQPFSDFSCFCWTHSTQIPSRRWGVGGSCRCIPEFSRPSNRLYAKGWGRVIMYIRHRHKNRFLHVLHHIIHENGKKNTGSTKAV